MSNRKRAHSQWANESTSQRKRTRDLDHSVDSDEDGQSDLEQAKPRRGAFRTDVYGSDDDDDADSDGGTATATGGGGYDDEGLVEDVTVLENDERPPTATTTIFGNGATDSGGPSSATLMSDQHYQDLAQASRIRQHRQIQRTFGPTMGSDNWSAPAGVTSLAADASRHEQLLGLTDNADYAMPPLAQSDNQRGKQPEGGPAPVEPKRHGNAADNNNNNNDDDDMFAPVTGKPPATDASGPTSPSLSSSSTKVVGQVQSSHDQFSANGEQTIEAFNMDQEMAEGDFDSAGVDSVATDRSGVDPADPSSQLLLQQEQEQWEREREEEAAQTKRSIERVTELCDLMMARGDFQIYETTYEQIVRELRQRDMIPDDWIPGTPLPSESTPAGEGTTSSPAPTQTQSGQWEYKYTAETGAEVYGPFSWSEIQDWYRQGYFTTDILVRQIPASPSSSTEPSIEFKPLQEYI
ncbi:hypothetical protein BJ085DRAFT_27853 [Dimargaris cristalligena]|uniref:GYF domain-containing protein n=1 Tax=Dimargaris cristalligena TaxID=215637 RepID=A0A4P9ZZT1_9FUNG|nr:hypothetical protein BJ085DRAFT_27853 [Dimargaris cristalligena]|eukprot:RKP39306.1 hypothetical protein BJ085DRAFT_27853 [Dimargaris cristalligena]